MISVELTPFCVCVFVVAFVSPSIPLEKSELVSRAVMGLGWVGLVT